MDANIQTSKELIKIEKMKINRIMYKVFKRILDIIGALVGCIILVPLTVCIWIANLLSNDNGPVFYVQKRIGKDRKNI